MTVNRIRRSHLQLGLTGAVAVALLASASVSGTADARPRADKGAELAQAALAKGQVDKAIGLAETAVQGSPNNAAYRSLLGQAYLKAGRFASASTAFNDAMELGDNSARTALGLALSNVAAGRSGEAVAILDDWRDAIPATDLGLALALSGETSRGVAVLADALRNGDNSAKLRQNLAYAYALDGRWREARLMVEQDVPVDQVDARISDWATQARPEDYKVRVANLLGTRIANDPGMPAALALNQAPAVQQAVVEAATVKAAPAVAAARQVELPPVAEPAAEVEQSLAAYTPVEATTPFGGAPVAAAPAPAPVAVAAVEEPATNSFAENFASGIGTAFVSQPIVQQLPVGYVAAAITAVPRAKVGPVRAEAPARVAAIGTHLIQLGSFSSQQGARRAWGLYTARNPELRGYTMNISQAVVNGRNFWRVAAAGFDGGNNAWSMCGAVKSRGGVCFAYSAARGVQGGAVPNTMLAKATVRKSTAGPVRARRR